MKTNKSLLLLASSAFAAAVFAACSVEPLDEPISEETPAGNNVVTLVTTLSPKTSPATKALTDPGDGTLSASWAVNEKIWGPKS